MLALSATTACGGQTSDGPANPNDPPECSTVANIDGKFGNGPLDELVGAVRTIRDLDAQIRSTLFDEIAALGLVYDVHGRGERLGMGELIPAIAQDAETSTASGITAKLGPVTCMENAAETSSSEARCLRGGCQGCDATTLCAEIGRLNGLASATCDGPTFDVSFAVAPGLSVEQEQALQNRVGQLLAHGPKILAAYARLSAILSGSAYDVVIFDPSPALEIKNEFQGLASADAPGLGIEPQCAPYAVPFVIAAVADLGDLTTNATYLLDEGDQFVALFRN